MKDHDELTKYRELLEKISPEFQELSLDINEILEYGKNPMFVSVLLFKLTEERQKTNKLLESIADKYDKIMLEMKTQSSHQEPTLTSNQTSNKFEVLSEQDQSILKIVELKGSTTAKEIQEKLNYKGLNAACQRLNSLFKAGYLKKISSGKKVLYLVSHP